LRAGNFLPGIAMKDTILTAADFAVPSVLLSGTVDYEMYKTFRDQLATVPQTGLVIVELSTLGGDPEVARMMGEDVRFLRARFRSFSSVAVSCGSPGEHADGSDQRPGG
jgi:membrane-bound ClpP family serine protease